MPHYSHKPEPATPREKLQKGKHTYPTGKKMKKGSRLECLGCKGKNPQCGGCGGKGYFIV